MWNPMRIVWGIQHWFRGNGTNVPGRFGYPPDLEKACDDSFDYAIRLRTGEVWRFREAEPISKSWVRLSDFMPLRSSPSGPDSGEYPFERGVCVRVSDIVWIADAPEGS